MTDPTPLSDDAPIPRIFDRVEEASLEEIGAWLRHPYVAHHPVSQQVALRLLAEVHRLRAENERLSVQPIVTDERGVRRFRGNALVRALYDCATARGFGLNELAEMQIGTPEEWQQLAQLLGYSLSGYSELPYVDDAAWARVEVEAARSEPESQTKDSAS
jgi:hypothetical protein